MHLFLNVFFFTCIIIYIFMFVVEKIFESYGTSPFADQTTSRIQNWKEANVWGSTVYSCDFHEGRQHFITLLMLVLNFAF